MFPAFKGRAKFNAPLHVERSVVSMSMTLEAVRSVIGVSAATRCYTTAELF